MKIPLTQGKEALIDEVDSDLMRFKWSTIKSRGFPRLYGYRKGLKIDNQQTVNIYMHRIILERKLGRILNPDEMTDHIDHNGLNNQRDNLRVVTCSLNNRNSRKGFEKTSQYKGVVWDKSRSKWMSRININGHDKYLGRFTDEVDAAKAYDEAAKIHYNEHANLNF
jgi:hypothetical protein